MPRLMIDLTGVEYDRLVEMARRERRTPQAQAAVVIGTTMAALAGEILPRADRSVRRRLGRGRGRPWPRSARSAPRAG